MGMDLREIFRTKLSLGSSVTSSAFVEGGRVTPEGQLDDECGCIITANRWWRLETRAERHDALNCTPITGNRVDAAP
jgi:hypothetical protein